MRALSPDWRPWSCITWQIRSCSLLTIVNRTSCRSCCSSASESSRAKLADDRRQLHRLAVTDDLTGLYNLRGFDAMLMPVIRTASQAGTPVTLVILDVDRLKSINDTHGHRAGADAVRSVGQIVGASLPDGAFGCRFGGDEFVIALPGHDVPAASGTAEVLRASGTRSRTRARGDVIPAWNAVNQCGSRLSSPLRPIVAGVRHARGDG